MLIGNLKFLNSLPENERQIFNEAAALATQVELDEWDKQVEEAKISPKTTWESNS